MSFLYVGNLGIDYDQDMLEKDFGYFGKIRETWHWPTFGYCFFEFEHRRDAEDALHEMNGAKTSDGKRMTIQWARRPRKHLPSRATTNDKCYICNRYGHFARDCPDIGTAAPVRRSPPRYRGGRGRRGREGYSPRRRSYSPRRRSNSPRRRTRSRSPYRSPDRRRSRSRSSSGHHHKTSSRTQRSNTRSPVRRSRS